MKILRFIPADHATKDVRPESAKSFIPQWYKDAEITYMHEVSPHNKKESPGLKRCIPFLDAMVSGYMLLTWTDIYVEKMNNGYISLSWNENITSNPVDERHGLIGHTIPRPAGHANNHLVWTPKWGIKSPKGYSLLITHPLNRHDLPFTTLSGLIDSDKFYPYGNMPFFIKEDFEGVIPKGTPYAQVIPIKRDKWFGMYDPSIMDEVDYQIHMVASKEAWYKKFIWKRKDYLIGENNDR